MTTWKKLNQGAWAQGTGVAGGAAASPGNIHEIFNTYLYDGNGATGQDVTNNVDLAGEGGAVWIKSRDQTYRHAMYNTERGGSRMLPVNETTAEQNDVGFGVTAFNTDGFTLTGNHTETNSTAEKYVSWTFRKAPGFFDVLTYTGTGTAQSVPHNLGSVPGMIVIKSIASGTWTVYHRGLGSVTQRLQLNLATGPDASGAGFWNNTAPTDTEFTVGNDGDVNNPGTTYVAYIFAHNDDGLGFGATQDVIKCGSYVSNGAIIGPEIDLGFEPQFVIIKSAIRPTNWLIWDTMRGVNSGYSEPVIRSSQSWSESFNNLLDVTSTGFKIISGDEDVNEGGGEEYVYIAIRRPQKVPTSGTEVFDLSLTDYTAEDTIVANIDVTDAFLVGRRSNTNNTSNGLFLFNRLTGNNRLRTDQAFAENAELGLTSIPFDTYYGVNAGSSDNNETVWNNLSGDPFIKYFMKRAPGFFDVVAYAGNSTAGRTVSHNLGVAPEMIWVKARGGTENWAVYHSGMGVNAWSFEARLDEDFAPSAAVGTWNHKDPTDTVFELGTSGSVNNSSLEYIAYLFATLPGISKVGSYTGNGTNQTIDCGFTTGARFVLIKRTDAAGDWYFWDTARGIVAGNDPYLALNWTSENEVTTDDSIDPDNSGFIVNQNTTTNINVTSAEYIYYAIA